VHKRENFSGDAGSDSIISATSDGENCGFVSMEKRFAVTDGKTESEFSRLTASSICFEDDVSVVFSDIGWSLFLK